MVVKCTGGVVIYWTKRRDIAVRVMKNNADFSFKMQNTILLKTNAMFIQA